MNAISRIGLVLAALTAMPLTTYADDVARTAAIGKTCLAVLIPNQLVATKTVNVDDAFYEYVCKSGFGANLSKGSGRGELEIFGVAKGSGGGDSETRSVTAEQYCGQKGAKVTESSMTSTLLTIVPSEARTNWLDCIKALSAPAAKEIVTVELADEGAEVSVLAKWNIDADQLGVSPSLTRDLEAGGVVCTSKGVLKAGAKLHRNGLLAKCRWSDPDATHGFVFVHTGRGSFRGAVERKGTTLGTATRLVTKRQLVRSEKTCSSVVTTNTQHNKRCGANYCSDLWTWTIQAAHGGSLVEPRLECVRDAGDGRNPLGSCEWNMIDRPNLLSTQASNGGRTLTVQRSIGSHSIDLRACAREDVYGDVPTPAGGPVALTHNYMFVIEVPSGSNGGVQVAWADGSSLTLEAGKSDPRLRVHATAKLGASTFYTYVAIDPKRPSR